MSTMAPTTPKHGRMMSQRTTRAAGLAFGAALLVSACGRDASRWQGVVYPSGDQLNAEGRMTFVDLGAFDSLDACASASVNYMAALIGRRDLSPSYECGRACVRLSSTAPHLATFECAEKAGPMAAYASELRLKQ